VSVIITTTAISQGGTQRNHLIQWNLPGAGMSLASALESAFALARIPQRYQATPPLKSILDPSFRYVSSGDTDVRKTFARIRRERGETSINPVAAKTAANSNVIHLHRRASAAKG
jgi:hypothetical protein